MPKFRKDDSTQILEDLEAACNYLENLRSRRAQDALASSSTTRSMLEKIVNAGGAEVFEGIEASLLAQWPEALRSHAKSLDGLLSDRSKYAASRLRRAADRLETAVQRAHSETK